MIKIKITPLAAEALRHSSERWHAAAERVNGTPTGTCQTCKVAEHEAYEDHGGEIPSAQVCSVYCPIGVYYVRSGAAAEAYPQWTLDNRTPCVKRYQNWLRSNTDKESEDNAKELAKYIDEVIDHCEVDQSTD
jgi:hypothetical protein